MLLEMKVALASVADTTAKTLLAAGNWYDHERILLCGWIEASPRALECTIGDSKIALFAWNSRTLGSKDALVHIVMNA